MAAINIQEISVTIEDAQPITASITGGGNDSHSILTNLDYASANHTGFQESLVAGNGIDITGTDITVVENEIDHINISSIGTNTHAQIDTHIADITNPHTVTLEQARIGGNVLTGQIDMGSNKIISLADPTLDTDAVTKQYVDSKIQGLEWQDSVSSFIDLTTAEPAVPMSGDRYINTVTGNTSTTTQAVTSNYIYEWNGTSWDETISLEGFSTWIDTEDIAYVFNGTSWVKLGSTITHNNLSGLQGGTSNEYYHLTSSEHNDLSGGALGSLTQGSVIFQGLNGLSQDNTNLFWDDTNNRLGIGTNNPNRKLDVSGIIGLENAGVEKGYLYPASSGLDVSFTGDSGSVRFDTRTSGVNYFTNGNVGIGTTTPKNKLDIEGGAVIGATYSGTNTAPTNGLLVEGDVGIGTTSPSTPLEIAGSDTSTFIKLHANPLVGTNYMDIDNVGIDIMRGTGSNVGFEMNLDNSGSWGSNSLAGSYQFNTNGINRLTILNGGNVGIGTTTPGAKLDIHETGNSGNQLRVYDDEGTTAGIRTYTTADGQGLILNSYYAIAGSPYVRYSDLVATTSGIESTEMRFFTKALSSNPAEAMRIDSSGNVGIGTTTPQNTLDIKSASSTNRGLAGTAAPFRIVTGAGLNTDEGLMMGVHDGDYSWIQAGKPGTAARDLSLQSDGGNVGINTTSPNTTLDVQGGQTVNITTVNTALYDLLVTDYILNVIYPTTAALTSLTLPTAQTVAGRIIIIKDASGNAGTNNITIDTEGAQTIDGSATNVINTNYGNVKLYCDGTNWFII